MFWKIVTAEDKALRSILYTILRTSFHSAGGLINHLSLPCPRTAQASGTECHSLPTTENEIQEKSYEK